MKNAWQKITLSRGDQDSASLPNSNRSLKRLLSIGEAAALLGVSIDTLRNWEEKGKIVSIRSGNGIRRYTKAQIKKLKPIKIKSSLLSIGEAAALLGVSIDTLRNWEEKGKIVSIRSGNGIRRYTKAQIKKLQPVKVQKPEPSTVSPSTTLMVDEHQASDSSVIHNSSFITHPTTVEDILLLNGVKPEEVVVFSEAEVVENQENHLPGVPQVQPHLKGATSYPLPATFFLNHKIYTFSGAALALFLVFAITLRLTNFSTNQQLSRVFNLNSSNNNRQSADSSIIHNSSFAIQPSSDVLAATTASYFLEINFDTAINGALAVGAEGIFVGNLTAPNILYGITAGSNVSVTSGQNPTISVNMPANIVNTIQGKSGTVTLTAGTDISISGLTIADNSTLTSVIGRGSCSDCITDPMVVDALTISSGGTVSGAAIKSDYVAASFGGTGLTTYTKGDLLYASDTTTLAKVAIGTSAQVLAVSGGVPVWADSAATGSVASVSNSDSTLTISPTTGAVVASLNLNKVNTWTATQTFSGAVIGSLSGILKGTAGTVGTATAGTDYQLPLAFTSPIVGTGNTVALAATTGSGSTVVLSDSPTLVGTPLAPTAGLGTSTSQIATTAFVFGQGFVTSSGITSVNGLTGPALTLANSVGSGTTLTINTADTNTTGLLTDTDWDTFNNKQNALAFSSPIIGTGGTVALSAVTGSGTTVVLSDSPTLITPTLGVATATSINKLTITTPASSATLTIADGKIFTVNNTITFSGTDSTIFTLPTVTDTLVGIGATQTLTSKTLSTGSTWNGGTIATAYGGTNKTGWAAYDLPFLSNATTFGNVGIGTSGQVLQVNGGANGYGWTSLSSYLTSALTSINGLTGPALALANSVGSGTTLTINTADTSTTGLLTDADWDTFNNKISSQWTTNGTSIYYNTGNVGIGTTAPTATLTLEGQIKITGGTPGANKILTSDVNGLATWETAAGGGVSSISNSDGTLTISPTTGVVTSSLNLSNINTWAVAQYFSGNVGIGTTVASYNFDVNGSARIGTLNGIIKGSTGALGTATAGTDYQLPLTFSTGIVGTGTTVTHSTANSYIHIPSDGASAQILQYQGTAGTAKWITTSGDVTVADGGAMAIGANKVTTTMLQATTGTGTTAVLSASPTLSGSIILPGPGIWNTNGNVGIGTTTPGTNTKLAVTGGNVGIGTTVPSAQLDVSGNVNFTGKLTEDGNEILSGIIAPFATACPTGWTEYTAARGRAVVGTPSGGTNAGTVGTALTNLANRTTTDTAAHLHSVDPGSTALSITDSGHLHSVDPASTALSLTDSGHLHSVDPASTALSLTDSGHLHSVDPPNTNTSSNSVTAIFGNGGGGGGIDADGEAVNTPKTLASSAHAHSVDIAAFNSASATTGISGSVNIVAFNSASATTGISGSVNIVAFNSASTTTGISGSVDIVAFNSASTGVASVDVTMPYIQLTYCQKTAGSDIAEWIPSNENLTKETIVSVDPDNREKVVSSRKAYDSTVIGIVATQPGWLMGDEKKDSVQMALAGRVPTRVTLKNGEINPGDAITTSSIPGIGMKATKAGSIVGKAMEALNETSALEPCTDPNTGTKEKCGTILVFVNISYFDPATAANTQDTEVTKAGSSYYDELAFDDNLTEGDLAGTYYLDAPLENDSLKTKSVGRVKKLDENSEAVFSGIITTSIGGSGSLIRRERVNNKIISEVRIVNSGLIKTKISPDSKPISRGDAIAVSANPGMGQKAIKAGYVIGRALEPWNPQSDKNMIMISLESYYYNPSTLALEAESFDSSLALLTNIEELGLAMQETQETNDDLIGVNNDILSQISATGFKAKLALADPLILTAVSAIKQEVEIKNIQTKLNDLIAKTSSITVSPDGSLYIPNLKVDKLVLNGSDIELRIKNNELRISDLEASTSSASINYSLSETESSRSAAAIAGVSTKISELESRLQSLESNYSSSESASREASSSSTFSTRLPAPERPPATTGTVGQGSDDGQASSNNNSTPSATISDTRSTIDGLTPPSVLLATQSAVLTDLTVTNDATISGRLKSLGETYLGDTIIAGNFSVDGTMSLSGNSINSIGSPTCSSSWLDQDPDSGVAPQGYFPLRGGACAPQNDGTLFLQNSPLAGKVDFFNGLVTIDNTGKVSIQKLEVSSMTLGEGTITAQTIKTIITNDLITDRSKVFVTAKRPVPIAVSEINAINKTFTVEISASQNADISFDWWIVDQK